MFYFSIYFLRHIEKKGIKKKIEIKDFGENSYKLNLLQYEHICQNIYRTQVGHV